MNREYEPFQKACAKFLLKPIMRNIAAFSDWKIVESNRNRKRHVIVDVSSFKGGGYENENN